MSNSYHLRVLDASVRLTGPRELLTPIVCAYGRFVTDEPAPEGVHEIRVESVAAGSFEDDGTVVPFIAGVDPTMQVYERFLNAVFDRVEDYAVLHAGSLVDANGSAMLIAGPSGFGKTSLTLELLRRGMGFLSDDYAPVELATGNVWPYPRTVGLLPGGGARTPRLFADAAADPASPRMLGKSLIDVGAVLGEAALVDRPVRIGHVVCLDVGEGDPAYRSIVHAGVWPHGVAEAEASIETMPGVAVLGREDRDDITVWRLELREEELSTERFSELLERDWIAFSETRPSASPSFRAQPRLTPLKRREVALLLCREAQNRRPRGRLMQAYGGDTTGLFFDVAAALAHAECQRLQVGDFDGTVALLEELAGR